MMAILRQSVLSLVALVFLGLLGTAQADTSPLGVALDQRVIDLTDTLDADTATRLKNQLADLEQRHLDAVVDAHALAAHFGGGRGEADPRGRARAGQGVDGGDARRQGAGCRWCSDCFE